MACNNPDNPCPGCHKAKTGCAGDILQDLFDDLMALAPAARASNPWRHVPAAGSAGPA